MAALLVFLFHFPPQGPLWDVVAGEGHVGVNIFFVLSGFLITARYQEALARGEVSLRDYFLRRAARILPLYYAVFILSQVLGPGGVSFDLARLPEWTLTQALFGESVGELVVPTSWSLTVEECFYASAPPLFYLLALLQRRFAGRPLLAQAAALLLLTAALFAAGAALWTVLDGRGPGFLRTPQKVAMYTLFGRFCDFAAGMIAALAWNAPRGAWRATLGRPRVALAATAASLAAIVAAQAGMRDAGGLGGEHWPAAWLWGLVLAPAAAGLIVSLAVRPNPAARALGFAPLVYLGKVSYAFYLIQLTPLGKGLLFRLLPSGDSLWTLLLLYLGMTAVSAALYELIEEPARKLVLRLGARRPAPESSGRAPWILAGGAAAALALAAAASSLERTGPVTLAEIGVAGVAADDVLSVKGAETRAGRDVLLLGLPRRWQEGWGEDRRAPSTLHVFVERTPVPFSRTDTGHGGPAAFYRGPRAEHLALRLEAAPRELVVVRETPFLALRLHALRLLGAPARLALVTAAFAAALVLAAAAFARRPRPARRGGERAAA